MPGPLQKGGVMSEAAIGASGPGGMNPSPTNRKTPMARGHGRDDAMDLLVAVDGVDDAVGLLGIGVDDAIRLLAGVGVVQAASNHGVNLLSGLVGLLFVENQEADDLLLTSRGGDDQVDDEGVDNVVDAKQQQNQTQQERFGQSRKSP